MCRLFYVKKSLFLSSPLFFHSLEMSLLPEATFLNLYFDSTVCSIDLSMLRLVPHPNNSFFLISLMTFPSSFSLILFLFSFQKRTANVMQNFPDVF